MMNPDFRATIIAELNKNPDLRKKVLKLKKNLDGNIRGHEDEHSLDEKTRLQIEEDKATLENIFNTETSLFIARTKEDRLKMYNDIENLKIES